MARKYMDVPWRFIISARWLSEPEHSVSQTGAVVAEDEFGNLTCVVSNCHKEIGERIAVDHNRNLLGAERMEQREELARAALYHLGLDPDKPAPQWQGEKIGKLRWEYIADVFDAGRASVPQNEVLF